MMILERKGKIRPNICKRRDAPIVTLLAARLPARQRQRVAAAAWYPKPRPTFADALAAVRYAIWRERTLATSPRRRARTKPRFRLPAPWAYALCHTA